MIIDDKNKFVFQHIPKTGGTFISEIISFYVYTAYVLGQSGLHWYVRDDEEGIGYLEKEIAEFTPYQQGSCGPISHMEFRRLKDEIIADHKLLICVREPVSRMVSFYCDVVLKNNRYEEGTSFEDFVLHQTYNFDPIHSVGKKVEYSVDLANDNAGSEVIKFENLGEDLFKILTKWGIEIGPQFKKNLLEDRGVRHVLDNKSIVRFRQTPQDQKDAVMKECVEKGLDIKIREYESLLVERYYS